MFLVFTSMLHYFQLVWVLYRSWLVLHIILMLLYVGSYLLQVPEASECALRYRNFCKLLNYALTFWSVSVLVYIVIFAFYFCFSITGRGTFDVYFSLRTSNLYLCRWVNHSTSRGRTEIMFRLCYCRNYWGQVNCKLWFYVGSDPRNM